MRDKPILVREVRVPVPTINRLTTCYERSHRDKESAQLWIAIALIVGPLLVLWEVMS